MHHKRNRRLIAAAVLATALGLVAVPAGDALAAPCTWQQNAWQLPAGSDGAELHGYDGSRYTVGRSGTRDFWHEGLLDMHPTLWDNGTVVWRSPEFLPYVWDVNSSGVMVGAGLEGDNQAYPIKITKDGTATRLPTDPAWESADADLINNRGDIVGTATKPGLKYAVVLWPADAPGTYRELPSPAPSSDNAVPQLAAIDEQGEIIGGIQNDPLSGLWTTSGTFHHFETPQFADPEAIRNGHVVGGWSTFSTYGAAEWNAQGAMTRSIPGTSGIVKFTALGGNGTIGGIHFVGSQQRTALWRDGQVVDPLDAVDAGFTLQWMSDDERDLIGTDDLAPMTYHCG